jgi:hypothetical protein
MSNTTTEHSLWLTPEGGTAAARQFRDTIDDLIAVHEDAVVFKPHITVVGGIGGDRTALTETTQSLAAETDPLAVTLGDGGVSRRGTSVSSNSLSRRSNCSISVSGRATRFHFPLRRTSRI